jgi:hypothetical protein
MATTTFTPGFFYFKYDPSFRSRDLDLRVSTSKDEADVEIRRGTKTLVHTTVLPSDETADLVSQFTNTMADAANSIRLGRNGVTKLSRAKDMIGSEADMMVFYPSHVLNARNGTFRMFVDNDVPNSMDAVAQGSLDRATKSPGAMKDAIASAMSLFAAKDKLPS